MRFLSEVCQGCGKDRYIRRCCVWDATARVRKRVGRFSSRGRLPVQFFNAPKEYLVFTCIGCCPYHQNSNYRIQGTSLSKRKFPPLRMVVPEQLVPEGL